MGKHCMEHGWMSFLHCPEGPDEARYVEAAAYGGETKERNMASLEFPLELIGHDAKHNRSEPLPVEFAQKVEQMTLNATECVPFDEVHDSDRVLQAWLRRTGQGGEHFLGHGGSF